MGACPGQKFRLPRSAKFPLIPLGHVVVTIWHLSAASIYQRHVGNAEHQRHSVRATPGAPQRGKGKNPKSTSRLAIEKQVSHLAARLGDQQAAMAGRAMGRAVAASVVRLVIGAHRIIGADGHALERAAQDAGKSRGRSHKAAERALRSRGRRVNQNSASVGIGPFGVPDRT